MLLNLAVQITYLISNDEKTMKHQLRGFQYIINIIAKG
jgi:hypothetical protein